MQKIAEMAKAWVASIMTGASTFIIQWASAPETADAVNNAIDQGFNTLNAGMKSLAAAALAWVVTWATKNRAPAE